MATNITTNRLITPSVQALFKGHELYSQDGKERNANCIARYSIGNIRWYMLEGQPEGNDFIFYGIVVGTQDTEYGYVSANEMADISIDASRYGLWTLQVEQDKAFQPCKLSEIKDQELQAFLSYMYDNKHNNQAV